MNYRTILPLKLLLDGIRHQIRVLACSLALCHHTTFDVLKGYLIVSAFSVHLSSSAERASGVLPSNHFVRRFYLDICEVKSTEMIAQ